jgi:hypothetical protein
MRPRETQLVVNDDPRDRPEPEATDDAARREPPRLRVVGEDAYADWDAIYVDNRHPHLSAQVLQGR